MNTSNRNSRKTWIILMIGLVVQILFDPLSSFLNLTENIQARVGLPSASNKWELLNTADYSFRFIVLRPVDIPNKMRVEVRKGEVVEIYPILLESDELEGEPLPPTAWKISDSDDFFDNFANFTIPQIFDEVERSLQDISKISFDAKYGFVSEVRFGNPNGSGLLSSRISHCCWGFEIYDFQIVEK